MSDRQFLYMKIGTTSVVAAEKVLRQVVTPVMSRGGYLASGDHSVWFFLRYLDATGLHIRIRVHGEAAKLCELEGQLRQQLAYWHADHPEEVSYLRRAIYVPEWRKWGGSTGVRRAEQVFTASSRLALSTPQQCWNHRFGLALSVMRAGIDLLPVQQRASFTYHYAWFWAGGDSPGLPVTREAVRRGARVAQGRLAEEILLWAREPGEWRHLKDHYLDALAGDLASFDHPAQRLFNHLHLTANRLGISPRDEALLAELLRIPQFSTDLIEETA